MKVVLLPGDGISPEVMETAERVLSSLPLDLESLPLGGLATSRLWRDVVTDVARDYPDVELEHMLVDNAAMQLVTAPDQFDVLLTENMFGDILSDEAAALCGGLGLAASASLADGGPGIFEPVHGSAPDIAGKGNANPAGMLRSTALMLELAFEQPEAADALRSAVDAALEQTPTPDVGG